MTQMHERTARLYEAALAAKKISGTNQLTEMARLLNASVQTVKNWEVRGVSRQGALDAQLAFGVSATWVLEGSGDMFTATDGSSEYGARMLKELHETKGQIAVWDTPEDLPNDEGRVWIDRFDYQCSAGDGVIQWEIRQKRALPFTADFFKAINSKPASCRLGEARGDSMEPYLFNRDMIMMDLDKTFVRDGGIYAICFEGESLVKQLFKQSGGLLTLHSYNPKYPDRLVQLTDETDFRVVGEIVYRSGAGRAAA